MTLLVARRTAGQQAGELQCSRNSNCEQTVSSQCDPLRHVFCSRSTIGKYFLPRGRTFKIANKGTTLGNPV
jgi:hypothetical protein